MKTNHTIHSLFAAIVWAFAVSLFATPIARAQEIDENDPLGGVIADMQVAGTRLEKLQTDKPTQGKQKDAIDKLEALIKLLEEQRGQGQGQSNARPQRPAKESTILSGPGGSGPLHAANRNGKNWGQLPAHKRDEIVQSMSEGFPAHYQRLLELYYLRLAEEKPLDAAEAGPKTGPERSAPRGAMPAKKPAGGDNPPSAKANP